MTHKTTIIAKLDKMVESLDNHKVEHWDFFQIHALLDIIAEEWNLTPSEILKYMPISIYMAKKGIDHVSEKKKIQPETAD